MKKMEDARRIQNGWVWSNGTQCG